MPCMDTNCQHSVKRLLPLVLLALCACDRLGIPDPGKEAASQEAEGKAIGGACRYAGRALEDCYLMNASASKAAIFAGWKEMNDYMTENKIEVVKPELAGKPPVAEASPPEAADAEADSSNSSSSRRRSRTSTSSTRD
jgi:hypothetical protein